MKIMSINKHSLFKTTDIDIWFCVLVPLANRKKKEGYRDLDVVIRYYKKSVFSVKLI